MKGDHRDSFGAKNGGMGEPQLARFGSSAVVNMESETYYPDPFADDFSIPKFSSVNPLESGNFPHQIE